MPDYNKQMQEMIKKSFPKLKNKRIWIYESNNTKFKSASADTYYFLFFWRIRLAKRLRTYPKNYIKAILAHELGHVEIFQKKNLIGKAIHNVIYFLSRRYREKEEKNVDKLAIEKGYGKELYLFRKYNLSIADEKTKEKIRMYYLSPKEIKKYIKVLR